MFKLIKLLCCIILAIVAFQEQANATNAQCYQETRRISEPDSLGPSKQNNNKKTYRVTFEIRLIHKGKPGDWKPESVEFDASSGTSAFWKKSREVHKKAEQLLAADCAKKKCENP